MVNRKYQHEIEFEVRDYECDLQGIVNNANYQHYLEHARHKLLETLDLDFASLHDEGINLVVVRIEIDYKFPMGSRDKFIVCTNYHRKGQLKIIFNQDIYRLNDNKLIVQAEVTATGLQNGRPVMPQFIIAKLEIAAITEKENI